MNKYTPSLPFVGFLQSFFLFVYCLLVGSFMLNAQSWLGNRPGVIGPAVFLVIFMVSAVICALTYLGYPFLLFWEHKRTKDALRLVIYTTLWSIVYLAISLLLILVTKTS